MYWYKNVTQANMSCPGWHASPGGDFISVQGKLSIINRIQLAVYYQCCVLIG